MVDIRVRIRDTKMQDYLYTAPIRNRKMFEHWQREGSEETRRVMRSLAPLGKTFQLRESIISKFTPKGFTTYPDVYYAKYVEEGTKPHTILPRHTQALRWFGPWGAPIFAKRVEHPGTKPTHFIKRTREQCRKLLKTLWQILWREYN